MHSIDEYWIPFGQIRWIPGFEHLEEILKNGTRHYRYNDSCSIVIFHDFSSNISLLVKIKDIALERDFEVGKLINKNEKINEFFVKTYGYFEYTSYGIFRSGVIMEYFWGELLNKVSTRKLIDLHPLMTEVIYELSLNKFTHNDICSNVIVKNEKCTYYFSGKEFKSQYRIKIIDFSRSFIDGIATMMADCSFTPVSPGLFNPLADFMYYLVYYAIFTGDINNLIYLFNINGYNYETRRDVGNYAGFYRSNNRFNHLSTDMRIAYIERDLEIFCPDLLALSQNELEKKEIEIYEEFKSEKVKLILPGRLEVLNQRYKSGKDRKIPFITYVCQKHYSNFDEKALKSLEVKYLDIFSQITSCINYKRINNQEFTAKELYNILKRL